MRLRRLQPWCRRSIMVRLEAIEYGVCGLAAEAVVTYDMLVGVDEAFGSRKRKKVRGSEDSSRPPWPRRCAAPRFYKSREGDAREHYSTTAQARRWRSTWPALTNCCR